MTADSQVKVLVLGSGGRLGAALLRGLKHQFDVTGFNHAQLDLADPADLHRKIDKVDFNVLINSAAMTNVDLCESQRAAAFQINAEAPRILAEICAEKNAKLIHISTDYVFDGEKRTPYLEEDAAEPISIYGESKRAGEINVLAVQDRHLVLRVSWVFGPDRPSFIDNIIAAARAKEKVEAVADKFSAPTYTRDLAEMLPRLFDVDLAGGLLHFANAGECSWQEYGQHALDCCHALGLPLKTRTVAPLKLSDIKQFVARRPVYTVLSTAKFAALSGAEPRSWRDALADYIESSYSKK